MKHLFIISAVMMLAATTLTAQESPKRYGIKSGEFKTVTEVMGQKVNSHTWFDNYGALSRSDESSMGISITTLLKDGKTYMVDTADKQVQEMPVQESINYLDLNEDVIAKYKVSEVGTDVVSGKECIKYSLEVTEMGQTTNLTVSVWQGFPMKTVTSFGGMEITVTITEITEYEVNPTVFEIPEF